MLRGHFKFFALHSLSIVLVASPLLAANPGDASRHAATGVPRAIHDGAVRNAVGLRPVGQPNPIQQVVGKQPASRKVDANRSRQLLPSLFGGSKPQTPSRTQSVPGNGILSDFFGGSSSTPKRPAEAIDKTPANVDWQGIPYHSARSQPAAAQRQMPIRDPRPGETRLAGPREMPTPNALTRVSQNNPDVPKPPALAPAPSSRRSVAVQVVSDRVQRTESAALSPLSSSRRSGRRDVPALDVSEVAAAAVAAADEDDLVPKVSRRIIKKEQKTNATAVAVAKGNSKPAATAAAASQSVESSTAPSKTPAADVAVNRSPAPDPASKPTPAPKRVAPTPAVEANRTNAAADPASIAAAAPAPATPPATTGPPSKTEIAKQTTPQGADNFTSSPGASVPQTIAASRPVPANALPVPANALPAPANALPAPDKSLFAAPRMPATPQFGHGGTVAGYRAGPPRGDFQPRTQPQAAIDPAGVPIGSGIASQPQPTAAAHPPQPTFGGTRTSTPPLAANPSPYHPDPYAAAPRIAQQPDRTTPDDRNAVPVAPSRTSLGTPMANTPSAVVPSPSPPSAGSQSTAAAMSSETAFSQTPFHAPPKPRPAQGPLATRELQPGRTAVASELPGIRVVTHGPSSVVIRQIHEFEIRVENRGSIDATGVMIRAIVPKWADVKGRTSSRGEIENQDSDDSGHLVWKLDALPAGTSEKLFLRLQALESGMHTLDVDWTLVPQKSVAKIEVREPKLDLVIEGPEAVIYGESQTYKVRVLNPGDGVAPNVVFTLSPNSSTPQTQRIGDIPSGKEAQFEVELTAQDLGDLKIHGLAKGDLGLKAQAEKTILVSAAELEAVLAGPEMKYQNSDATYLLQLTNQGTATCKNVNASLALPPGIRYLGGIDLARQVGTKLAWQIDSLPPGATREYEFSCTMISPGEQKFEFAADGSAAGRASVALDTLVESIADLVMTIQDPAAPAPVGSEVIYEILIKNRGSRQANGVRAIAQFSNGIEPRRIEGHSGQVLTGQVLLDPIDTIRPGEQVRIRVIAEAESEGHHRFRTEIRSGETVLVAEEATQYLSKSGQRVSRRSSSSSEAR